MNNNMRRLAMGLLIVGGAACAHDAHAVSHDRAVERAHNDTTGNDTHSAATLPKVAPDDMPSERGQRKLPAVAEPGRVATDVPSPTEAAPPVVPIDEPTSAEQAMGPAAADNTAINERDRNHANVVPTDQGSSDVDMRITKRIRESVVDDGDLSFTAHNVKIITMDGHVVLRGPVKTAAERRAIERHAVAVAGKQNVTNELEVR
jgi:hyperosmotically inducible protein